MIGETLKIIRDLTIIIAIYLYFIAWVYVHFYYQQFGISTDAIRIDYNSYLMYSYNVIISARFMSWIEGYFFAAVLIFLFLLLLRWLSGKYVYFGKLRAFVANQISLKKFNKMYGLIFLIAFSIFVFPQLFRISRDAAIDNYKDDRLNTHNLKTIQFIFRKDADLMSPAVVLDSSLSRDNIFYADIGLIKNDPQQLLRLLGESDTYYIVMQQRPYNSKIGALPSGYVYFINKKDILLSKIILRSL
ncbi:MAG: hypothetical protein ABI416_04945 [Ginsengibacter sp.]